MLTGDELGVLIADRVLISDSGGDRLVATTIVSSTMLSAMAKAAGVAYVETLTGFKWIARAAVSPSVGSGSCSLRGGAGYEVGDAVSDRTVTCRLRWSLRR